MTFLKISPKPYKGYTYWIMQVVDLFGIFSWEMSFPECSSLKVGMTFLPEICHFQKVLSSFRGGNALLNIVSNSRKVSSACFPNCPFISSPYWSLSAFFKSVVNNFFAWPLWYSLIHSAQTDLSKGMQVVWCQSNDHVATSKLFPFMLISTCFTKIARTCFAEELGRSFFAIFTL